MTLCGGWGGWVGGVGCYDQLCCPASPKLLLGLDSGLGCDNLLVSLSVSPWIKIQSVYRCRPLKHTIHIFYIFIYFYLYPILDILKRRRAQNIHVQKLDPVLLVLSHPWSLRFQVPKWFIHCFYRQSKVL